MKIFRTLFIMMPLLALDRLFFLERINEKKVFFIHHALKGELFFNNFKKGHERFFSSYSKIFFSTHKICVISRRFLMPHNIHVTSNPIITISGKKVAAQFIVLLPNSSSVYYNAFLLLFWRYKILFLVTSGVGKQWLQ